LDNFKETMAEKIYDSIQKSIEELDILIFANASNVFGHNFGEKRLKKIFEIYPKVLVWIKNKTHDTIKNDIKKIEGFEEITASQFAEKIIEFEKLVNKLPKDIQKKVSEYKVHTQIVQDSKISGKVFVFSGFRNAEWEKYIENHGGKINSTVSSKTNYVVTTQEEITSAGNSKVKKAIELSIELLNKENFEKKFIKN
jgi:DNA ligase (NAD+)